MYRYIYIDNMQVDSFSVLLICGPQETKYNTRQIDRQKDRQIEGYIDMYNVGRKIDRCWR